MLTHNRQKKLHDFWSRRGLFVVGLAMTLMVSVAATTNVSALYILTGVDDAAIVLDKSIVKQTPKVEHELVCVTSKGREYDISLTAGQTVTIRRGDEIIVRIDPYAPLQDGDVLVVIGGNDDIQKIANLR